MKPQITLNKKIASHVFVLVLAVFSSTGILAAPLTVHLTGGFTDQEFTIDYGDGTYDDITVSATVDLVFTPSQPTCSGANFTSSTAQVTGTIHTWGSAIYYDPSPSLTENFDNTYNYNLASVAAPITYEGQTGLGGVQDLYWQIATTRSHDNALPYRIHYFGASQLLRLWISLPYPFWYNEDDEFYDTTGTATVSGQESVNSCLSGTVRDGATGQPIVGAAVRFGNVPQATDGNGTFYYGNIPANTYLLTVTNSGYYPYTNILAVPAFTILQTNISLTAKVPVILVHGWRGAPSTWNSIMVALTNNGIDCYAVDYSPARGDPRVYAQKVASAVAAYRQAGYTGKVDIVCHSMGALVSRWYMERLDGGKNVRQWIGIAPVDQGAAIANYPGNYLPLLAWLASAVVEDVRHDGAVTQMRTDSDTVTTLIGQGRSPDVIYRVIAGYNGCGADYSPSCQVNLSEEFRHPFLTRGKTVASITDERGVVHPHAWTYYGDVLVALVQSQLPGATSADCFVNLGHNTLPQNSAVIAQVVSYLRDLGACSLNNWPSMADLLRDADVETIGAGNQGFIYGGEQHTHTFPVDGSVQKLTASVTYNGSQLAMTLFTPSGTAIVPGAYPVLDYSNSVGSVWYVIDSPTAGNWSARIDAVDVPPEGEPYSFQVSFSSPQELVVGAATAGQPLHTGQTVPLWANFHNGTNPIIGASVSAGLAKPNGQTNHLDFYDDGTHGDLTPGDGIYSAAFSPDMLGSYTLSVTASTGLVQRVETLQLEVEPAATRPILGVSLAGAAVQLTWTAPIGAFLLEGSTNLSSSNWFAEDTVPEIGSNYLHTATLSPNGPRYFRLRGP